MMDFASNSNCIYIKAEPSRISLPPKYALFFITGNPGCIGYYHLFLASIFEALSRRSHEVDVYGASMYNFGDDAQDPVPGKQKRTMLSLREQIEYIEYHLLEFAKFLRKDSKTEAAPKIIIISHSVGSYIGLEILRRWRAQVNRNGVDMEARIIGHIAIWPTVTWISKSSSGRKVSVSRAVTRLSERD